MEIWKGEPRDAGRIQLFCDKLARAWEKLPDWRFGQIMINIMWKYEAENGSKIFFLEEDEMIGIIEDYCERFSRGKSSDR